MITHRSISFMASLVVSLILLCALSDRAVAQSAGFRHLTGYVDSGGGQGANLVGQPASLIVGYSPGEPTHFALSINGQPIWTGSHPDDYNPYDEDGWNHCWHSNGFFVCLRLVPFDNFIEISDGNGNYVIIHF